MNEETEKLKNLIRPIPLELPTVAGWKEVPLVESGEPLVALDSYDLFTDSIYFGERENSPYREGSLSGAMLTMLARREVAQRMQKAESMLPSGLHLLVKDAWRSLRVQQSLYDTYLNELRQQHPDLSDDELSRETQKFVSIPSTDPKKPSPHNTGGAIDVVLIRLPDSLEEEVAELTRQIKDLRATDWKEAFVLEMRRNFLVNQNGEELNFGVSFDWGGEEAALNYLEHLALKRELTAQEKEALNNRRLLYNLMKSIGMEPYVDEFWHYNAPESQMGAKTAGLEQARYGSAELSNENVEYKEAREWLRNQIRALQNGRFHETLDVYPPPWFLMATHFAGELRKTKFAPAAVIKPTRL